MMNIKCCRLLLICFALTGFLSACNQKEQLKSVEEFSLISENIKQSSASIINDFDDSCIRREEIENQKLSMVNQPVMDKDGEPIFPLVNIREQCEKWIPIVSQTNQINDTLILYIQSLGKLASDDTVTFTDNVQTLGNSVNQLSNTLNTVGVANISLGEKQQQAGINIVNSLLNIWSSQFRYEKLKPAIICTDLYFAEYISLLEEIIDKIYLQKQLGEEENAIKSKYKLAYQIAIQNSSSNPEVLASTVIDLQNDYRQEIGNFDQRKQAAISYLQILELSKQLHHGLANNFLGNTTEPENLCKNYFQEEGTETTNATKIQNDHNLSYQQLNQANQLIKNYQIKISPLVKKINENNLY